MLPQFLPETGDCRVVSAAGDGLLLYSDLARPDQQSAATSLNCHDGTVYEVRMRWFATDRPSLRLQVVTVPGDPHSFLSCGEDGTVRWFDLRMKTSCRLVSCTEDVLINCGRAVTSLALNPLKPAQVTNLMLFMHSLSKSQMLIGSQLAVGCSDSAVRLYDRRQLGRGGAHFPLHPGRAGEPPP